METFRDFLNTAIADALFDPVEPGEVIDAVATATDATEQFEAAIESFALDDVVPTHVDYMRGVFKVFAASPSVISSETELPAPAPAAASTLTTAEKLLDPNLTTTELAEGLGVSLRTARRYRQHGDLPTSSVQDLDTLHRKIQRRKGYIPAETSAARPGGAEARPTPPAAEKAAPDTFRDFLNSAIGNALREPVDPGEYVDAVATATEITEQFEAAIAPSFTLDDVVPTHVDYMRGVWKVVTRGAVVFTLGDAG